MALLERKSAQKFVDSVLTSSLQFHRVRKELADLLTASFTLGKVDPKEAVQFPLSKYQVLRQFLNSRSEQLQLKDALKLAFDTTIVELSELLNPQPGTEGSRPGSPAESSEGDMRGSGLGLPSPAVRKSSEKKDASGKEKKAGKEKKPDDDVSAS